MQLKQFNPQEMRPQDIQTIEELIDNNFTIHGSNQSYRDIKEMEFTKRARFVILDKNTNDSHFLNNLTQGSNRALGGC
jgi:hypothetical protein